MTDITPAFWQWVEAHSKDDPAKLRLKFHNTAADGIDLPLAITQIECRRRFAPKFAETLSRDPHFLFAGYINGEQATGDRLARWHAGLIPSGSRVADLTSGLGIDVINLTLNGCTATALEQQPDVAAALAYNARTLGLEPRLTVICEDSTQWIRQQADSSYDWLFIDPARRAADGSRVFDLADCTPDLSVLQTEMLRVAPRYVAKLSPMLDISRTVSQLEHVVRICTVGTATECKELVAVVDSLAEAPEQVPVCAVTLLPDGGESRIEFTAAQERSAEVVYGMPKAGDWLLEPYPALMKAAPHRLLCALAGAKKIAPNTHVYFAAQAGDAALGRWLEIEAVLPYSSGEIKRFRRRWPEALVAERNFGLSAQALRAKLGVKDGGTTRVVGVSDASDRRWLVVARTRQ